ncbi:MAG: chloride channel protein [Bacteroidales bacterium]|nr:chloride channel protein [Bacteroidales bacterium]
MAPVTMIPQIKISERNKLLLLSLATGVCSGLAAVLLTWSISFVGSHLGNVFPGRDSNWIYLLLPGMGMLIAYLLVRYVIRDNIGHGVTRVLVAVSRNESRIKPHNIWSSVLTSSITIGFGGSVGAEAPIVYTGAAIGSNLGRWCGLSHRSVTILLGCGAAGAVAGIFKAPLAGVLFTIEILLFNVSMSSMLPLLMSTISATVVAYIFRGQTPMFACDLTAFSMSNIPFYLIMGVTIGFCSLYFTKFTLWLEDRIGKIGNGYLRWLICSAGLGLLIYLFPPLYGQGYDSLHALLNGEYAGLPLFFVLVFLFKVVAMTLTNAGGGVGGTFGPTLFEGAVMGFVVARFINMAGGDVPEANFVLVGMAAMMAGVMQAPMTAIFLIAEISGGYGLLIPLILTSTVSFGTVRIFEKYSIYTKRIAQSGDLLTHDNDQAVLALLQTRDLVRDKYPRVGVDSTLGDIMKTVSESTAAVFPVLDSDGRFQGVLEMDDLRKYMFKPGQYKSLRVYNLMHDAPVCIEENEKMDSVVSKFDATDAWRLPVLDTDGKYLGFISRSRLLMAYRSELKEISSED